MALRNAETSQNELSRNQAARKPGEGSVKKRPGPGRPAACEVAGRREHLLDTATAVFLEHGFENAKVEEIAVRAGASKNTLYSLYPTKAELFVAVIARKTRQVQGAFAEILVPGESLVNALEGFGTRLLSAIANPQQRALYKLFIAESSKFPKLARKFWGVGPARSIAMLSEYLAGHPEFKSEHPEHAAEMFWSLCCGTQVLRMQMQHLDDISENTIRFNVKEAVRIFLASYTSDFKVSKGRLK
jgi:AcrR family transcriptional regulator